MIDLTESEVARHAKDLNALGRKATVGVDLDGSLAEYSGVWGAPIGKPVLPMLVKIYELRAQGKKVVLFTARAEEPSLIPEIKAWLEPLGLADMEITNKKSLDMVTFYDDRAIQLIPNTGERADGKPL